GMLLRFQEGYANSFKIRGYRSGQAANLDQNNPTLIYNTESGFYNTLWNGYPNGINLDGIADHGTRLRANLPGLPANLGFYVTVGSVSGGAQGFTGAYGVVSDASGANLSGPFTPVVATSTAYSNASNPSYVTFGDALTSTTANNFTGSAGAPISASTNGF